MRSVRVAGARRSSYPWSVGLVALAGVSGTSCFLNFHGGAAGLARQSAGSSCLSVGLVQKSLLAGGHRSLSGSLA